MTKKASDVFGISQGVLSDSYVDRGGLDSKITKFLARNYHIAIRGSSKSGKSWLRQQIIPDSIVIQCRLGKTVEDIYRESLGQLGVKLEIGKSSSSQISGSVEAESEFGVHLIGKVKAKLAGSKTVGDTLEKQDLRQSIHDLDFIAEIIKESGKRLVIEDFHYLSRAERKRFSFDLKAFWDLGLYAVIIGVWSDHNLLLDLNPDLSARVKEFSLVWSTEELTKILDRGSKALNVEFSHSVKSKMVEISYGSAGILQRLALDTLDEVEVAGKRWETQYVDDDGALESAAMFYAEELNTIYQKFAQRVSSGIRKRKNSTGIYGHALAIILDAADDELVVGVPVSSVFDISHRREPRIQLGNLKSAMEKIEGLQVDEDGRGLVLSFAEDKVRVVDHQLLLYRRYATVQWPWEDMIREAESSGEDFSGTSLE